MPTLPPQKPTEGNGKGGYISNKQIKRNIKKQKEKFIDKIKEEIKKKKPPK